jgi:hypothetical protein
MESLLQKKYVQCRALWVFILREASSPGTYRLRVSDILDLAHILEKNIHTALSTGLFTPSSTPLTEELERVLKFYNLPEIANNQVKLSNQSVSYQLHNWQNRKTASRKSSINNPFSLLYPSILDDPDTIQDNQPVQTIKALEEKSPTQSNQTCWVNDT